MSFYDDASLVVIPSAQKTSKLYAVKPTDGSGDLTFTRTGDTATRVNSAGLIERVRTNLLTYSNTFSNAAWLNDDSTETSGQAGYDGTTNAWLLSKTAANGRISEVLTVSGSATFSIYAKAGTDSWLFLASSDAGVNAYFNLGTGAVGTTGGSTTAAITSVGNGWYRCSISGNASFTFFNIWVADANNDTSGASGNILIQSAQVETGDIATPYIPTTTAAVSVGPVANVPRLDYLGSTCPRLLLEPQRTNSQTFSEQHNNAAWSKLNLSVTANAGTSPDGYSNADLVYPNTGVVNVQNYNSQTRTGLTIGASYTQSVFLKASGFTWAIVDNANGSSGAWFNLVTGTIGTVVAGSTAKIENYGNGWYRCSVTSAPSGTTGYGDYRLANADNNDNVTANGTNGILAWGFQFEAGAYATSYIPTLAATATRGEDACSKTGISSLIGQTEGTLFVDFQFNGYDNLQKWIAFLYGSANLYIGFYTNASSIIQAEVYNTGIQFLSSTFVFAVGQRYKLALAYKANDFAFYVNGAQIATDNSGTVPATSEINLQYTTAANALTARTYNQALLFKTRLTNAELAELTTL